MIAQNYVWLNLSTRRLYMITATTKILPIERPLYRDVVIVLIVFEMLLLQKNSNTIIGAHLYDYAHLFKYEIMRV